MKKSADFILFFILMYMKHQTCTANETVYVDYSNQSIQYGLQASEENPYERLMLQQYILLGWVSFFIILIGILGNIFAIRVLMHSNMQTAIDIHFIGLSLSDLLSLILILFTIPLRYILVSHNVLWYLRIK